MMIKDIEWLAANSGDATLLEFTYTYNSLCFKLRLFEHKGVCQVKINTDLFVFNVIPPSQSRGYGTCFFRIEKIAENIQSQNGFYIPDITFPKVMEARRMNWTLAYGLKVSEYPYMVNLIGSHRLLSCLIKSLDEIYVELTDD